MTGKIGNRWGMALYCVFSLFASTRWLGYDELWSSKENVRLRMSSGNFGNNFEKKNAPRWCETDVVMTALEQKNDNGLVKEFPRMFRQLCSDLALANHRMHEMRVVNRLNEAVIRGYKLLYRGRRSGLEGVVRFAVETFPQTVRAEWRLFWLSNAFFWVPFFAMFFSVWADVTWVQSVMGQDGMSSMEQMYGGDSQSQVVHLRSEFGSNFMMFAHYIQNNVGIDFQLFAGGVLAGLGTIFFLVANGVMIGAAAGYVQYACNPTSFWTFVSGHSSFELLGMCVVGMAGLRMGLGILNPGRLPRTRALRESTAKALPLLYGGAVMTALAAVVEGFWSAQDLPHNLKYGVGIFFWVLHVVYFLYVGRAGVRHTARNRVSEEVRG
jgi:uncharacterized membrane protein SpoIIM required for sporulation